MADPAELIAVCDRLARAAMTTGGTAGPDPELVAAHEAFSRHRQEIVAAITPSPFKRCADHKWFDPECQETGCKSLTLAALSPAPTVPEGFVMVPKWVLDALFDSYCRREPEPIKFSVLTPPNVLPNSFVMERAFKAWEAVADMLAASPQPPVVDGWRDIASAPRDGTIILSWDGTYIMPIAWSTRDDVWFVGDDEREYWTGVTHWMPLPAPPAAPEAGR